MKPTEPERDWAQTWQQILDAGWGWDRIGKTLGVTISNRMAMAFQSGVAPPARFTQRVLAMVDAPKKASVKKPTPKRATP